MDIRPTFMGRFNQKTMKPLSEFLADMHEELAHVQEFNSLDVAINSVRSKMESWMKKLNELDILDEVPYVHVINLDLMTPMGIDEQIGNVTMQRDCYIAYKQKDKQIKVNIDGVFSRVLSPLLKHKKK